MTGSAPSLPESIAVAVAGAGGSGALTAGLILLAAARRAGRYALMTRSAGPQIRGGESAAMVRFAEQPVRCIGDSFAVLAALDWHAHGRFSDELPLAGGALVLSDPDADPVPEIIQRNEPRILKIAFGAIAAAHADGRANMVAVGAVGAAVALPLEALLAGVEEALADRGERIIEAARRCIFAGYTALDRGPEPAAGYPPSTKAPSVKRWNISGNEAAGLGALRGGIRFVAAYPITPASEMLEWLAPRLERLGGDLLQAEDELASINMIIGSAFGGVPSLTATSGPGLSLMMEGLGLAVASETPVVVVDVMRGGPSTGIPTKSEQSDLDLALYGMHGDAPHLVLAPLDIADCAFTLDWATGLAERLQTAAIVLSDQSLGQARAIIDPPDRHDADRLGQGAAACCQPGVDGYRRYALTPNGISPRALPGEPDCAYTADGLEHDSRGTPSSLAADHLTQLDKRLRKLAQFDYGDSWGKIEGPEPDNADLCLITWGSSSGAVREAGGRLRAQHRSVRIIALRLLAPLQRTQLIAAIGDTPVLVVEQNHQGQLWHYLHAQRVLPAKAQLLARPGPLPLRPGEIVAAALGTGRK